MFSSPVAFSMMNMGTSRIASGRVSVAMIAANRNPEPRNRSLENPYPARELSTTTSSTPTTVMTTVLVK